MAEYIDRGKLISDIEYQHWCYNADANLAKLVVYAQPTADVVPVVHGRWEGNVCSACRLPWNDLMVSNGDDWGYFDPMPPYCPNCGAKMDGGAAND